MDGRSLGVSSKHLISKSGTHMISQDQQEAIQCSRPKWYYSTREIDNHSPSRKDGIDFEKETRLRSLYCSFVQDLGMKLKVPQMTIATAMMFCHRFYLHQSHSKNDWQTIATVSVFLACKVEETPRLLVDVIVVAYETIHRQDPSASQRIKQKDVYEKQKALILIGERLLMATIGFDFNLHHPYKPLVAALKKLDISHNDVAKVAWNFVNDWLRTTLCLQYKPHYIAAGSMYLAAKFCKLKLPSEKGKAWWMEFDVSPRQLEEVIKQMLSLLEKNKEQPHPSSSSSHEKGTQTQPEVAKTTTSCSPQPCESMNKPYLQPAEPCVVNGEVSQSQTSDCGSCQSVVEDEGEVQVGFPKPDCKIVSLHQGLSKMDRDRIKETLRKRKYEKAANNKVVTLDDDMMNDDDSWIVRELENGIEDKRQRL